MTDKSWQDTNSGLPCKGVYLLLSLLPRRTDSIPRYYLVVKSTVCLEMVKMVTKSHVAHKPFIHIQKFHSVLESYLIKWKDTVEKTKQSKTRHSSKQQQPNTSKRFCKLAILQGFAALLNSLLMEKYVQVTTPHGNLSCVHVWHKREARWSDLPLPMCLIGSLCSVLSFPFMKQKSLMDIFIMTEMDWVRWIES